MDLKDIKQIASIMSEHDLTEFELEEEGFKVSMRRGHAVAYGQIPTAPPIVVNTSPAIVGQGSAPSAPESARLPAAAPPAEASRKANAKHITSEMPGTFFRSPSPSAKPFVEIGDKVVPSTVICIIEAMKVMNQITADCAGEIVDILVENGEAVEYGQALFAIRTA